MRLPGENGRARRGFTLVELTVGMSIVAVVAGAMFTIVNSMGGAYQTSMSLVTIEASMRQSLGRVAKILETVSEGSLSPTSPLPANTPCSAIDFQRVVGFTDGAAVLGDVERLELEYTASDPDDGLDNDGDGLVDEGRLVWIERPGAVDERRHVIVDGVAEALAGELIGNNADDNGNVVEDERGFNVEYGNGRITVRLTIERQVAPGQVLQRTVRRTVLIED